MNKRDALEVGIKLFGMYFLVQLITGVATIMAMVCYADPRMGLTDKNWLFMFIPVVLALIACILCLWKGRCIAEFLTKEPAGDQVAAPMLAPSQLSFWLRILGLFFGMTAGVSLVSIIIHFLVIDHTLSLRTPHFTDGLVQLSFSLALVFKNIPIAAFLEKGDNKVTPG